MRSYKTVIGNTESLFTIERSKFICNLKGVENEEEAKEFLLEIRKRHSLANHNCYAYIADENGLIQKFSDDGEPQGTAGMPMLNVLKSKALYKTIAVVTRYFGGIKLGAGGLVRAYGNAVAETVKEAQICEMVFSSVYDVRASYATYEKLSVGIIKRAKIISKEFGDGVILNCAVKYEDKENFENFLKESDFNIKVSEKGEGYFPF